MVDDMDIVVVGVGTFVDGDGGDEESLDEGSLDEESRGRQYSLSPWKSSVRQEAQSPRVKLRHASKASEGPEEFPVELIGPERH